MPKTTKPFDWEVWEGEDFIDIITMRRSEVKEYKKLHPTHTLKEIGYNEDGDENNTRKSNSKEREHLFCIRSRR